MTTFRPTIGAVALLLSAAALGAQQTDPLTGRPYQIGERVRVTAPSLGNDPIVGVVDSVRETTVVLDTAQHERRFFLDPGPPTIDKFRRIVISYDDIRRLEVSAGRSKRKGAITGGIIGGLVGMLSYGFSSTPQYNPGWSDFKRGIIPGLAIGVPVGAVLGSVMGKERWHSVPGPFKPAALPAQSRTGG